jgi:general secretion pathway protein H
MNSRGRGFTILELLAAITIAGLVMAVAVPSSVRLYESMQYRGAVKDAVTLFASARYRAINTGKPQDVVINPGARELRLNDTIQSLPGGLNVIVHSARELNRQDAGVIRFYPEGGSSGGGVDIEIPGRGGVRIDVDWLVGRVSQEKYALN